MIGTTDITSSIATIATLDPGPGSYIASATFTAQNLGVSNAPVNCVMNDDDASYSKSLGPFVSGADDSGYVFSMTVPVTLSGMQKIELMSEQHRLRSRYRGRPAHQAHRDQGRLTSSAVSRRKLVDTGRPGRRPVSAVGQGSSRMR
jgi:hypothetical protein